MQIHNFGITGWPMFIKTLTEGGAPILPTDRGVTCCPVVLPDGQRAVQVPHVYWELMDTIPWQVDPVPDMCGTSAWGLVVMGVLYGVGHFVNGTTFKTPYDAVRDGTIMETIQNEARVLDWVGTFMRAQRWPQFPKYTQYHLGVYAEAEETAKGWDPGLVDGIIEAVDTITREDNTHSNTQ